MAPIYRLTYFNMPYLAEPIRFMFKYGNIEFEDIRITHEQWRSMTEFKNKTLTGQLPILEYDGKIQPQSTAICRYVAKLVKLTGETDWEDLEIDAVVDTIGDIRARLSQIFRAKDATQKEIVTKSIVEEYLPTVLKALNDRAIGGYLANGKLSWADFQLAAFSDIFYWLLKKDIFQDYPNLKTTQKNVLELPSIKTYIENRPKYNPDSY